MICGLILKKIVPACSLLLASFVLHPVLTRFVPRPVVSVLGWIDWEFGQVDGPWMRVAATRAAAETSTAEFRWLALQVLDGGLERTLTDPEFMLLEKLLSDHATPRYAVKRLLDSGCKLSFGAVSDSENRVFEGCFDRELSYPMTPLLRSSLSLGGDNIDMFVGAERIDFGAFSFMLQDFSRGRPGRVSEMIDYRDRDRLNELLVGYGGADDGQSGVIVRVRFHVPRAVGTVDCWEATARVPLSRLRDERSTFEFPLSFELIGER